MGDQAIHHDVHSWNDMNPEQVLLTLLHDLYSPVSVLGTHLNRLTGDDDPLTEEDMDGIFDQMQTAVRQLSKTVVNLKQYTRDHQGVPPPPPAAED
jgi:K+-sensing histidine kinase KdpD